MINKIRVWVGTAFIAIGMWLYGFSNEDMVTIGRWVEQELDRLSRAARSDIDVVFSDENHRAFTVIKKHDEQ